MNILRLVSLLILPIGLLQAANSNSSRLDAGTLAAVEAADAARVAALLAGDRNGLDAIFSDDLYFVHANGRRDTKAGYIEALATRQTVFTKYTYQDRDFRQLAPGIVQMAGRTLVGTPGGELDLDFLAVWRNENGKWRFAAWHSVRHPPAAAPAPADSELQSALRIADDERVAAILSGDRARMDAIFSNDLSYTHSNGDFDNKATYMEKLVSGSTRYSEYRYTDRKFTRIAPGLALMNARVIIKGRSVASPQLDVYLSVLTVYREEQGKWRFLAWQSARLPQPAATQK